MSIERSYRLILENKIPNIIIERGSRMTDKGLYMEYVYKWKHSELGFGCELHYDGNKFIASRNILKQGLCGLGTKSHSKQKRCEALEMVCGKTQRVSKSLTSETRNQLLVSGNPLPLGGG